ncbi:MAG: hypothetical protein ISS01_02720 [Nanoarchaeota archaeon]|nr:hypothetical protein [Nanoarchaeota archaeon]
MKRLFVIFILLIFTVSLVNAELFESDENYKRQIYFPGYIQIDDLIYTDSCETDLSVSNSVLVVSEVGEATDYVDERYYETVYIKNGEVQEWSEYRSYLKEYCADYDTCEDISSDVETRTVSGEEFYSVNTYCEYGCVSSDQGGYCLSSQELNSALDNVNEVNYGLGCNEEDSGLDFLTPTTTLHRKVFTSYEYTDTCNVYNLKEACCGCEEGNKKGGKVWVKSYECSDGCVNNRDGADFCAEEEWVQCSTDSQCIDHHECVDGECVERVTELVRNVDEDDIQISCSYFGCDCDKDGSIDDSRFFREGESVSALAASLCNGVPGDQIAGNDVWCDDSPGIWYPVTESEEEECYADGIDEDDIMPRPVRRAAESLSLWDSMVSKVRNWF